MANGDATRRYIFILMGICCHKNMLDIASEFNVDYVINRKSVRCKNTWNSNGISFRQDVVFQSQTEYYTISASNESRINDLDFFFSFVFLVEFHF